MKIPRPKFRHLITVGIVVSLSFFGGSIRSEETKPSKDNIFDKSITTEDVKIPVEDLKLLIKPLTLTDLEIEANAWFFLLKNKVQEISYAEIAINKENRVIDAEKDAADKLKEAQKALLEAEELQKNATQGSPEYEKAAKQVEEAKEKLKEAEELVSVVIENQKELEQDENLTAELEKAEEDLEIEQAKTLLEQTKKDRDGLEAGSVSYDAITLKIDTLDSAITSFETAKEDLEGAIPDSDEYKELTLQIGEARKGLKVAVEAIEGKTDPESEGTSLEELEKTNELLENQSDNIKVDSEIQLSNNSSDIVAQEQPNLEEKSQQLEEASEILEENSEKGAEIKQKLIETVTKLQGEQTAIIDRFTVVLDEYETKGGDPASYKQYIESVSAITFDIQDTDGLGIRILSWLKSEEGGVRLLLTFGKFAGTFILIAVGTQIAGNVSKKVLDKIDAVSMIFTDFIVVTIKRGGLVLGVLVGLAVTGVNLGPLLALIGGVSFVLAFALQSNLGNFASGLMLMINKPFDVGHEVKIAGLWGYIESINLASTKIRGFDRQIYTLPNNMVWGGMVENLSSEELRRGKVPVRVPFDTDLRKVKAILIELGKAHPLVLKDKPVSAYVYKGNEWFIYTGVKYYSKADDFWIIYEDLTFAIRERFEKEGIPMVVPRQEILLKGLSASAQTEQADLSQEQQMLKAISNSEPGNNN